MDNDDALIGTIWSRRRTLKAGLGALIGGGMASGLLSCVSATTGRQPASVSSASPPVQSHPLIASPAMTEGPFFVDEKLNRTNLLAGTTRPAVVNGTPLQLNLNVLCLDAKGNAIPYSGAQIDVWHSDTAGIYSDEDDPINPEVTSGQRWLRGYQLIDTAGKATFSTVVPGWYEGRTPHIHFKVRQFSTAKQKTAEFTSQFFFDDKLLNQIYANAPYNKRGSRQMLNTDDGIYSERLKDGSLSGEHQLLSLVPIGHGYSSEFTIVLTDASLHGHVPRPRRAAGWTAAR